MYMPSVVDISTETVRVEVSAPSAGGVTWVGSKVVVTPVMGSEVTARSTDALKPFKDVMVMVEESESPCWMVSDVGEALIAKSRGGGSSVISNVMSTLCTRVPLVPVTVRM